MYNCAKSNKERQRERELERERERERERGGEGGKEYYSPVLCLAFFDFRPSSTKVKSFPGG